jgi:hypothetical protein
MPGRATHRRVGVTTAVGVGVWRLKPDESFASGAGFLLGCAAGGYAGSVAPDVLEPALTPLHRCMCHSMAALGGIGHGAMGLLEWADRTRSGPITGADGVPRTATPADEFLRSLLVGFAVGFVAAYASHLVLDARTPLSLPLIHSRIV